MKYLRKIASEFRTREDLSEYCFVFPNRRAGLFFQKYLGELTDIPIFSPAITTIKDLLINFSGLREADKLDMLFRLYKLYGEISDKVESFDEFLFWGETILSDYNDVDKFMADPKRLFSNIKDLKEIEADYSFLSEAQLVAIRSFWEGFLKEGSSEKKSRFTALWSILYPLYEEIRKSLFAEGCGYEGMMYRYVAENPELIDKASKYKKIVFVGLNALNSCEKSVMLELKKRGIADFYWDYNGYMVTDPDNAASRFMQENVTLFPSQIEIESYEENIPDIEVIGVASSVIQSKLVSSILKDVGGDINSAVILPDERLLMPLLHSIPENISSVNVSMGYQLRSSPIYSLIEAIIELVRDEKGYYHKRVLPILRHSYIKLICREDSDRIIEDIIERNMIYISPEYLSVNSLFTAIFGKESLKNRTEKNSLHDDEIITIGDSSDSSDLSELCNRLLALIDILVSSGGIKGMDKEFAYHIYITLKRIDGILIPMSKESFAKLLLQLLNSISIPFRGEPLSGLQIMGILETRLLDFENIIYCSMNEGLFPQNPYGNSFIPYNLRRGFNLPVKEYNDAISSYVFYRSICRAKKVFLLHDTRSEGLGSGERSRFILQLKYHYRLPIKESTVPFRISHSARERFCVKKSPAIVEQIKKLFLKGGVKSLSATSIDTYITCPLKFYLRYIKEVEEEDRVAEEVEADDFGKIFHKAMESIYSSYKGQVVTKEILLQILRNRAAIESIIVAGFLEFKNINEIQGYNLLIKRIILKYVEQTLHHDMTLAPFDYIGSEIKLNKLFQLNEDTEVQLKGFVDRYDRCSGVRRIIDYKSGKGSMKFRELPELFDGNSRSRNGIVFQMLFYAYMMDIDENVEIVPYFLRNMFKEQEPGMVVDREMLDSFTELLGNTLLQLFDIDIPFAGRERDKSCDICPYSQICY